MNILITGNLSLLARTCADELTNQKHRVVLAANNIDHLGIHSKSAILHSIDPSWDIFREAISSYGFDAVVFLATREEQLHGQEGPGTGSQLDALRNTLELAKSQNLKHFFYISSTEVYGTAEQRLEDAEPVPASLNGHALSAGEQYCRHYQNEYQLNITILRLPYVYGLHENEGFLYGLVQDCKSGNPITLPGDMTKLNNFLHARDFADFLKRALDEEYSTQDIIINLCSLASLTNSELCALLHEHFPTTSFSFDEETKLYTGPAGGSVAKNRFDWVDLRNFKTELAEYIDHLDATPAKKKAGARTRFTRFASIVELLKPVELILGAILIQFLSQLTGTLIQYKYIDFRLLFVVLMASMYGLRYGLLASLLMSLSLIYTWFQLQIDWNLLIFNVGNWFPPVLYFVTGLIIGYAHDRYQTILENQKNQTQLIYDKYQFLYEVFNEIRKLKDEFREQVIGYRDSFGKIYTITRELDTLQEQDVFLKALNILEDVMENDSIAIYRLEPDLRYARLEVSSASLRSTLVKSFKLTDYPEAVQSIGQGIIFQNTTLLPNYPAYLAPVFNNSYPFNVPVAIIVIWSVSFERYSTYYYNLFKVVCGLIQASLVRASKFLDANYERLYIAATRIMKPEAFNEILRARAEMNKNMISVDQLIQVDRGGLSFEDLYFSISEGIRVGDVVGLRADDKCYILLCQADKTAASQVVTRLEKLGLHSRLLNDQEAQVAQLELTPSLTYHR
jgi:UDP-glucose 4-epimerase